MSVQAQPHLCCTGREAVMVLFRSHRVRPVLQSQAGFSVSLWRRMNQALAWDVRLCWVPPSARGFLSDHDKVALLLYLCNEDGISEP